MTPAGTTHTQDPVELVPDKLFLLGGDIALDGRISWAPADARGWQPCNCYVLLEEENCLVVDPGPALLGETVVEQLKTLIPAGSTLSIFLSRAELDTTGGIGAIARAFPVDRLYAGGGPNPFDSFEAAGDVQFADRRERIQLERMPTGFAMPIGPRRRLEVVAPTLRLLATWWSYDDATGTLFTSDSFTHSFNPGERGPRLLTDATSEQGRPGQLQAHLTAKFEWLHHAKTPTLRRGLESVLQDRRITRIAPAHGLVLEGEAVVAQHVETMLAVLQELAS